ncbi:MAG: FtsW/RodA/SpoVE family cell cycle protein [Tannerella sp.]|jgi:cell division protein FtsW|nr:FtsW/RodA/SpoVE family cell cycle protein [Tannerella sp.]
MELANKLFKGDRSVWIIFMLLCFVSILEVYSASSKFAYKAYYWTPIVKHVTFMAIGFGVVLVLHNIPSRFFSIAILLLPISIVLLILTPIFGVSTNEAHRWLSIFGITFQPSEFGKLACVVFVAFVLSRQERFTPDRSFWIILIGVGLTCGCIVLDNFSTAFLLAAVCFIMMYIGQLPGKKLIITLLVVVGLGAGMFFGFRSLPKEIVPTRFWTWKERIDDFGKDNKDTKFMRTKDNWQVVHSKVAIAQGGFLGKLPGRSMQKDFLPEAFSDFIYAIIIEEMGLIIGGIGVLMLYVILMFRVAIIARRCEKLFPKYLALGCGLLIVVQALINMAVAVNLIPVTGQPLPLISRGGTSTILTCCYFGIILSVSRFSAGMGDEENEPVEPNEQTDNSLNVESETIEP